MSTVINDSHFAAKGFLISTDKNLLDFNVIYNYLAQESYWAKGIPEDKLRRAIVNSICFGVYHEQKQIGFARVITDEATFGYLADVFILPEYRKLGLSKWLVQTITQYPAFEGLRRWSLATRDAHSLYAQFGFTPVDKPELWMQIYQPYQTVNQN